jgi:hypothetical protein
MHPVLLYHATATSLLPAEAAWLVEALQDFYNMGEILLHY